MLKFSKNKAQNITPIDKHTEIIQASIGTGYPSKGSRIILIKYANGFNINNTFVSSEKFFSNHIIGVKKKEIRIKEPIISDKSKNLAVAIAIIIMTQNDVKIIRNNPQIEKNILSKLG